MSRMTDYCDVACDECGCWEPGIYTTISEERLRLKKRFWTIRWQNGEKQDVCPCCNGYNEFYWGIQT